MGKPACVFALLALVLSACLGRSGPEAWAVRDLAFHVNPATHVLRMSWTPPERAYELRRYEWRFLSPDAGHVLPCARAAQKTSCWSGIHPPGILELPLAAGVEGPSQALHFELWSVYHRHHRISGELVRAWQGPVSSLEIVLPEGFALSLAPRS